LEFFSCGEEKDTMGSQLHFSNTSTLIRHEEQLVAPIIKTISYFDIFDFPLTSREIHHYSSVKIDFVEFQKTIDFLVSNGKLKQVKEYYLPFFSAAENVDKRFENEHRAKSIEPKVRRYSRIISSFPFVECVCISGSYSKGVIAKDGDVDYFIITKPGRLWLSRTLLVLFKKVILLNSRKYFCVNYFIDSNHLEIPDKNLFSSTEIRTLIPVYNEVLFAKFLAENKWASNELPNAHYSVNKNLLIHQNSFIKQFSEKVFAGFIGERLDNFCFRITLKHWKKKFAHFDENEFDINMRTKKNVSKHHPQGFQKRVLVALNERIDKFKLV
jgi:hypothetical protein